LLAIKLNPSEFQSQNVVHVQKCLTPTTGFIKKWFMRSDKRRQLTNKNYLPSMRYIWVLSAQYAYKRRSGVQY